MQHTQGRRGPAFARRGKGTGGTRQGDRAQGAQRIDRAPRDSRGEPRFDEAPRPSRRPPYMNEPVNRGGRSDRGRSNERFDRAPKFDQRTRGPRAAAASTSWENVAEWYGTHLSAPGTYQTEVVWPGAMRLLGVGEGKLFIDVACGEGTFAQMISKQGGAVVGLDASPTLIRQAQMKKMRNADFVVGDASRFAHQFDGSQKGFDKRIFDGAAMILAAQNIEDLNAAFAHTSKVLAKGAPFVIVLNHPAFRVPRQSSWGFEDDRKLMYRRVDSYLTENAIPMIMNPGSSTSVKTTSFHRPIASYITMLVTNGFAVDALEEWVSHKESTSGPRAKAENRIRKEIPMFLAIRGRKI